MHQLKMRDPIRIDTIIVPVTDSLSRERIEEIAKKLQIRERAIDAARKNEPSSNDQHLDETQRIIVKEADFYTLAMTRRAKTEIADRENEIRQKMPVPLNTTLAEANVHRQVADAAHRQTEELDVAHQAERKAHRDLRGFEESNRLPPGSAIYNPDWVMFTSVIMALALIESAANAFLLQEMGDQGWFGGFGVAIGVTGLNVVLALMTGFVGWRLISHVKPSRRAIGWIVTVVGMLVALAMHAALGELREAVSHDPDARVDFLALLDHRKWLHYSSFPPFVLFVGGIIIFLITAFKSRGGRFGPVAPYWDHDTYDRRHAIARETVEEAKEGLLNSIQESYDGEVSKLRDSHAADVAKLGSIRHIGADAHQITRVLADSIREEIDRVGIWLKAYRSVNVAVRTTLPPAYFHEMPNLQEWYARRLDLSGVDALIAEAERTVDENATTLATLQEKLIRDQTKVLAGVAAEIQASEQRATGRIVKDYLDPGDREAGQGASDGESHA